MTRLKILRCSFGRRAAVLALVLGSSAVVRAQAPAAAPPGLGSTLTADLIQDLPSGDNLFQLLETTQPTLITDRFFGGGLYTGQSGRVGGFLSSWAQTLFTVDGVNMTDAAGQPLLLPSLAVLESVTIETGLLGSDVDAVGLAISVQPRKPAAAWTRSVEATTSHFGAATVAAGSIAPIARLNGWDRLAVLASGPIIANRLGVLVAASWMRGSQIERNESRSVRSGLASGFAHLVFTPTDHDEIRTVGWLQRSQRPFEYRLPFDQPDAETTGSAWHAMSVWDHRGPEQLPWRALASYTMRRQVPEFAPSPVVTIERLREGRAQSFAEIASDTFYRWSVGGRVGRTGDLTDRRHNLFAGIEAEGSGSRANDQYSGDVRELVDDVPARIWRFVNPGLESFRHEIGLAAFAGARIRLARNLQLSGGLLYDSVSGSAEGADAGIRWHTLLPRAGARWTFGGSRGASIFAGYTQSAYRLPLDWLAFGDPAAPTADVFRWDPGATPGPRVARVGPGTGGDPAFSGIAPGLRRPRTDELVVGLDLQPASGLRLRLTGMTRKERDLVGLTNTGGDAYELSEVFDPGANVGSPDDDRVVPVYNRRPATFGADRWLLSSLGGDEPTFEGIELTIELTRSNATLLVGGTAGRSQASGASRGFGALENDQGLVGEIDADPNARTFARGRPFADRAYTAKVVGVYRLPTRTTVGLIARYQDGQPFSRMLVVQHLNQGAEAIRAFASGDSRFMFTGTLDARLQQDVTRGSNRVQIVLDIYNLPGLSYSVEEQATQPPDVRITTAIQPPRAVHLGMRLTF